ncbi:MAG: putative metal-dependent hydrolase [Chitinophagales bacterium]|nr:putative metal-dependent hydrolase [Chitinophagales bacterium]MDW8426953.1 putative metal-dependent hydrolase [Chitinophagales bacterium]
MSEPSASEQDQYPIGRFVYRDPLSNEEVAAMIETIEKFPMRLAQLLSRFREDQMDLRYRPGGWTVRQVVHHLADAHMNAYIRFKMTLTEQLPTIKPYNEMAWAELLDAKTLPVNISLSLLEALHHRWVVLLKAMDEQMFRRTFFHPHHMKMHTLYELLAMYAWHCQHHYAHIERVVPQEQKEIEAAKSLRSRATPERNVPRSERKKHKK